MYLHENMLPILYHGYYRSNQTHLIDNKEIRKYIEKHKRFPYDILTYYGSRNSSKSYNVYNGIITHSEICEDDILVARWIQNSIKQSSFSQIKGICIQDKIDSKFKFTNTYIQNKRTKAKIEFRGVYMQADSIRSLSDSFKIIILEECQQFKEVELQALLATVLRFKDVLIIPIFNVGLISNPAYQRFVELSRDDDRSKIYLMNYYDNPYHTKESAMEKQRLIDLQTKPKDEYEAIWEGKPIRTLNSAIFNSSIMEKLFDNRETTLTPYDMEKVIISYDPAVTDKNVSEEDKSNSHALSVIGYKNGACYILKMNSLVCSPDIACKLCVDYYKEYKADYILYEENQGGLFVKSLILSIDPSIQTKAFRSVSNKIQRASQLVTPINNNSLKLMNDVENARDLEDQMRRITSTGFIRNYKNESPDLLDSLGFGVIDLLKLNMRNTQNAILPPSITFEDYYLEHTLIACYTYQNITHSIILSVHSRDSINYMHVHSIHTDTPNTFAFDKEKYDVIVTDRDYTNIEKFEDIYEIDKLPHSEELLQYVKEIMITDSNFKLLWDNYGGTPDSDSIFLRLCLYCMKMI